VSELSVDRVRYKGSMASRAARSAEVEELLADVLHPTRTDAYVFRPCIVAGPQAPLLIDSLP